MYLFSHLLNKKTNKKKENFMKKNDIIIASFAAVACCFMGYVIGAANVGADMTARFAPPPATEIKCAPVVAPSGR